MYDVVRGKNIQVSRVRPEDYEAEAFLLTEADARRFREALKAAGVTEFRFGGIPEHMYAEDGKGKRRSLWGVRFFAYNEQIKSAYRAFQRRS